MLIYPEKPQVSNKVQSQMSPCGRCFNTILPVESHCLCNSENATNPIHHFFSFKSGSALGTGKIFGSSHLAHNCTGMECRLSVQDED